MHVIVNSHGITKYIPTTEKFVHQIRYKGMYSKCLFLFTQKSRILQNMTRAGVISGQYIQYTQQILQMHHKYYIYTHGYGFLMAVTNNK